MSHPRSLGLQENLPQFALLVLINAFVGAMVGLERTILPTLAQEEFGLVAKSAILSFIVVFGITKALTNYLAGELSDHWGRRRVLILGWVAAVPVPFLLMWAPSWNWVLLANVFLGVSQGLTWSTTVIMKIDLVGSQRRGFAMGLNEFAGYFAVALSAWATGHVASHYGVRPEPFYLGVGYVVVGLALSLCCARETLPFVALEAKAHAPHHLSRRDIFLRTSFTDKNLSSVTQAGLVNNLNDGMAWGLFPILFATLGMPLTELGQLAAIYPASWGLGQLLTGGLSDRIGRKRLIVAGMWVQAAGLVLTAISSNYWVFALAGLLLGIGTAMVYPTLLATIGDVAHPSWRASSVGIYRLWRDLGYAIGALVAGVVADAFGVRAAIGFVALLTFVSGVVVFVRQQETLSSRASR
ncbi:MAG: MFS transporter [Bacteriovoracia bacterium]